MDIMKIDLFLCSELNGIDDSVVDIIILMRHMKLRDSTIQFGIILIIFQLDNVYIRMLILLQQLTGQIDLSKRGMIKVHSFCIGFEASPDLRFAKKVKYFQQHQNT